MDPVTPPMDYHSTSSSEWEDLNPKPTLEKEKEEEEKDQAKPQGTPLRFIPRSSDQPNNGGGGGLSNGGNEASGSASSSSAPSMPENQLKEKKKTVVKETTTATVNTTNTTKKEQNPGKAKKSWEWGNSFRIDRMDQHNQFVTGPQIAAEIDMKPGDIGMEMDMNMAMAGRVKKNGGGTSRKKGSSAEGSFLESDNDSKKKSGRKRAPVKQMPEILENGSRSGSQGSSSSALLEGEWFPPMGYDAQPMAMGGVARSGINSADIPLDVRKTRNREKMIDKEKGTEKEESRDTDLSSGEDAVRMTTMHLKMLTPRNSGSMSDERPISGPQRSARSQSSHSMDKNEIGRFDADDDEEHAIAISSSKIQELANNRSAELETGKMEGGGDSSGQEKGLKVRKGAKAQLGRDGVGTSGESRKKPGRKNPNATSMDQILGPEKDPPIMISRQSSGSNQGSTRSRREHLSSISSSVELEDPLVDIDTDSSNPPVNKGKNKDRKGKKIKSPAAIINTNSSRTGTEVDMISYNYSCAEMVRKFAVRYWKCVLTHEERKKARNDMIKIDQDGDGNISLDDLLLATSKRQHRTIKKLFKFLDQDQSGVLGLEECITLYYLKQIGYRICGTCHNPILNTGFTCKTCWELSSNNQGETFDLCIDCYTSNNYDHEHQDFLDDLVMRLQTASIAATAITVVQCIICGHYHDKKARGFLMKKEKHMLKLAIRSSGEVLENYVCEWCLLWSCNNCGKYFTSSLSDARPRLFLTKEYNCDECDKAGNSGHLKHVIEQIENDMKLRNACSTCDTIIRNGDLFNFSSKNKKGIAIPDALKKLGSHVMKSVKSSGIADIPIRANMDVGYGIDKDNCRLM